MSDGIRLNEILPASIDGLERAIEQGLQGKGSGSRSTLAWRFIRSSAADELHRAMDCDIFVLLAKAWSKTNELRELGHPSPQKARKTTIFHLGKHDIKTSIEPVLVLDFGIPPHPLLRFNVEVTAEFKSAALSVRNGHITSVAPGEAYVTAQMSYQGVPLHKAEESPKVRLPGRINFKPPGLEIG